MTVSKPQKYSEISPPSPSLIPSPPSPPSFSLLHLPPHPLSSISPLILSPLFPPLSSIPPPPPPPPPPSSPLLQVPVYQLPSVTEAELTKAEEEAKAYYLNLALRKELRTMSKKGKIKVSRWNKCC